MRINQFLMLSGVSAVLIVLTTATPRSADDARVKEEAGRVKSSLEQTLKSDPDNSELWAHLGFTDQKLGDIDGAQTAFEKARQLNPKNPDALYMLGLIYEKKQMKDDALKAWKDLLNVSDEKWRRDAAQKHIHHLNSNE